MTVPPATLIVLGGDETGLAVVRNAAVHRLRPLVVARPRDVTTRSRLARCIVADDVDADRALATLRPHGSEKTRPPLVATNDRWLRFVVAHRAELDQRFTVVHPNNQVLETCLNKRRFAAWCSEHRIPTPAVIESPELERGSMILRPELSNQTLRCPVPKAAVVTTAEQLAEARQAFDAARSPWVATRSLLAEARAQYSVAVAVRDERCLSFVAQKLRPFPDRCAVGTYVRLQPHPEAEALGRTVVRALEFDFGMAEVEIIGVASGALFVLEVNPRPWTQFGLSHRSGRDFLEFLLGPSPPRRRRPPRDGLSWIAFGNDLFTCFSRSAGLIRHGRLRLVDYLRSLARVRVCSRFALRDPSPALPQAFRAFRRS